MAQQQSYVYIDVSAMVRADEVKCDYGVERSPTWTEVENQSVDEVTFRIDGDLLTVEIDKLPEKLAKMIRRAMIDNCYSDGWVKDGL